jgi:hypothetical protein
MTTCSAYQQAQLTHYYQKVQQTEMLRKIFKPVAKCISYVNTECHVFEVQECSVSYTPVADDEMARSIPYYCHREGNYSKVP